MQMHIRKQKIAKNSFRLLVILTLLFMISSNFRHDIVKEGIVYWKAEVDSNVSCHYIEEGDALPSIEKLKFHPGWKRIFFHETSCRGGLNSRQACAVESAARAHPRWQVILLFSSPVSIYIRRRSNLAILRNFPNVQLARIHIKNFTRGIIPDGVLVDLRYSIYAVGHTSDILRMVSLKRWGGVYLDLDVVVARSLDAFPKNWVAKQNTIEFSFGTLGLGLDVVGRNVSNSLVRIICDRYNPDNRNFNGPDALTAVMRAICSDSSAKPDALCTAISVYEEDVFYPLPYTVANLYFMPGEVESITRGRKPFVHHMWNGLTWNLPVDKNSPYAKLAREYCPSTYAMYGDKFGV